MADMQEAQPEQKRKSKDRDGLHKRRNYWHYELIIDGKKRALGDPVPIVRGKCSIIRYLEPIGGR